MSIQNRTRIPKMTKSDLLFNCLVWLGMAAFVGLVAYMIIFEGVSSGGASGPYYCWRC